MFLLNVLFWIALAIDAGAIGLLFILGLAAAKPSHTNPLSVAFLLLFVPAALLIGLTVWFLRVQSPLARLIPFALVATPMLILAAGLATTGIGTLLNPAQQPTSFSPAPLNDIQNAVLAGDLDAVRKHAAGLRGHPGAAGILILALHRVEKAPGNLEILRALLAAGADPNNAPGQKPLEVAILASRKTGPAPVTMLLDAGANPDSRNPLGEPALFAATADPEILKLLLDRGAPVNTRMHTGETALTRAAAARNWKAVLVLLERGADPQGQALQDLVKSAAPTEDLLAVRQRLARQ